MDWNAIFTGGLITQWNTYTEEWFCHLIGKGFTGSSCAARLPGGTDGFLWPVIAFGLALMMFPFIADMVMAVFGMFGVKKLRNRVTWAGSTLWMSDDEVSDLGKAGFVDVGSVTSRKTMVMMDDEGNETLRAGVETYGRD